MGIGNLRFYIYPSILQVHNLVWTDIVYKQCGYED